MAFVFGSVVKETATPDSDIDIAVYFKLGSRRLEWEEEKIWPERLETPRPWGEGWTRSS